MEEIHKSHPDLVVAAAQWMTRPSIGTFKTEDGATQIFENHTWGPTMGPL